MDKQTLPLQNRQTEQVIFKPKILSPRNLFIVNLAGSDLLLCVFTMPLTFIEVSMKIWQMGECQRQCAHV